jgi:hypothetical protein
MHASLQLVSVEKKKFLDVHFSSSSSTFLVVETPNEPSLGIMTRSDLVAVNF